MAEPDPLAGQPLELRRGVTLRACHHPGTPPSLVFLHGGLGNRFNWRNQLEYARGRGWECLAYDLAGHGQSSAYSRYSIGRHCRDLDRLLQRFSIRRPLLCAHSYGVPIALEWARNHRPLGLVLAAGGTHDLDPWWEAAMVWTMEAAGRHLFRSPAVRELNRRLISRGEGPAIDRFFRECPVPFEREPYRSLHVFRGYDFHGRSEARVFHDLPTLILTGGRDPLFNRPMGEALASHFRPSRHVHLPEAGHVLMVEEPEAVNAAIAAWIEAHGLEREGEAAGADQSGRR